MKIPNFIISPCSGRSEAAVWGPRGSITLRRNQNGKQESEAEVLNDRSARLTIAKVLLEDPACALKLCFGEFVKV
jgi:hypothetical protein